MNEEKIVANDWKITGLYFEACNCETVCPCIFASRPTVPDNCTVVDGWHIDEGHFGDVDLAGLNVAMAVQSPGHMLEVKWNVALYLDEKADEAQSHALIQIFTGQAGGHPALLANHVGKVLGVRSVPIEFKAQGKRRSITIPGVTDVGIEAIEGQGGGDVVVTGHPLCVAPGAPGVVARSKRFHYEDHGYEWEITERSALFSPFAYSGP